MYEVTAKFVVSHEIDNIENLKDNNEFASDLVQMVCDEASTCGAVATYEIIESKIDIDTGERKPNDLIRKAFGKKLC